MCPNPCPYQRPVSAYPGRISGCGHRAAMTSYRNTPAIEATGPRKAFGDKVVLDGIDLNVAEGTIFSLLGHSAGAIPWSRPMLGWHRGAIPTVHPNPPAVALRHGGRRPVPRGLVRAGPRPHPPAQRRPAQDSRVTSVELRPQQVIHRLPRLDSRPSSCCLTPKRSTRERVRLAAALGPHAWLPRPLPRQACRCSVTFIISHRRGWPDGVPGRARSFG